MTPEQQAALEAARSRLKRTFTPEQEAALSAARSRVSASNAEAPQYAANGVPMNNAAKRELMEKARSGTLELSPQRLNTVDAFNRVVDTQMRNEPTQFGTFMANLAPGVAFGFADEIAGGIDAALTDRTYEESVEMLRNRDREMAEAFPKTAVSGQVGGAVSSPISAAIAPVRGASLAETAVRGVASGAAGGAIYGYGTGEGGVEQRVGNALRGGIGGALIGGAIPLSGQYGQRAIEGIANSRAAKAAIAAAPSMDDLRATAGRLYAQADTVNNLPRSDFATQAGGMLDDAARSGLDDMLTPGAARVASRIDDAAQSADPNIGFRELDILRKQAGVPAGNVANRTEAAIGSKMIAGIDDYIDSVDPSLSGALREARDMWGQLRRSEVVEKAISKAKDSASGFENGLRVEFRKIVSNPKLARGFNEAEMAAMRQVVQGTPAGNLMRQIGRIGIGIGGQSNGLGATVGGLGIAALSNPLVGAGAVALGTGMKALAQRSTRQSAERAAAMIANRGALQGLPQASFPAVGNALATIGAGIIPQASVQLGNALVGR